jgi:hypothetical protein
VWAAECRAKARRYVDLVHLHVGGLPRFAVNHEAMGVVEVDGVGIAVRGARLASGLRWRWGVVGLGGLCWSGSGGGWELGLVDGRWGGIEAGSFATLRMTG